MVKRPPTIAVIAGGGAAVVAISLAGLGLGWWDGSSEKALPNAPMSVGATLAPRAFAFGDTVRAGLDIAINPELVDPATVAIEPRFEPFRVTKLEQRRSRPSDDAIVLSLRYTLECFDATCVPPAPDIRLPPGSISYWTHEGIQQVRAIVWPSMRILSRATEIDLAGPLTSITGDPNPPPVSYSASPDLLAALLLIGSGLLALLATGLAVFALRRAPQEVIEEGPDLSPLERALIAIREHSANSTAAARRKALQRLARELGAAGHGGLAEEAGHLAWSRTHPTSTDVSALTSRVEETLGAPA